VVREQNEQRHVVLVSQWRALVGAVAGARAVRVPLPPPGHAVTPGRPAVANRLIVSLLVACAAAAISYVKIHALGYATDFAWFWVAGRSVLHGQNPYAVVQPGGPFHFDAGFMYPLPAALASVPFGALPILPASLLFSALSAGALAFAMTREGWSRLPVLMSFPMLWCASSGQWAPLVTAAALSSGFAWVAACKPTLGLAAFLRNPSWRFVAMSAVLVVIAFAVNPSWPVEWLRATQARPYAAGAYHVPLLVPGGALLLLAAFRWRDADARLLLGMAVVPQTMLFYDQLALGLLASTRIQAYVFGLWSYAVAVAGFVLAPATELDKSSSVDYLASVIVWGYYLPALAVVLTRRNIAPDRIR
jgi:hypothetical protein